MRTAEELKTIFADYAALANSLPKTSPLKKFLQGGSDSSEQHPCHKVFFADVESWVRDFSAQEPSPEQRREALEVLLLTAADYKKQAPFWFMVAVQRHALSLIPGLEEDARLALVERYQALYPYNTQLPVQQEAEKLLLGGRTPSVWQRLFGK